MTSSLITALVSIAVSFAMLVLVVLTPTLVWDQFALMTVAQNAARVAAITQNTQAVQQEIQTDLTAEHLPTTYHGQTLFTLTNLQVTTSPTGYSVAGGPSTTNTTVTIQYDAPLPFDRALTLFGGSALPATVTMTQTASYFNETQYTGAGA